MKIFVTVRPAFESLKPRYFGSHRAFLFVFSKMGSIDESEEEDEVKMCSLWLSLGRVTFVMVFVGLGGVAGVSLCFSWANFGVF